MITIFTPVYYSGEHRRSYFKQYIKSLEKLNNIDKLRFLFVLEPGSDPMLQIIPNNINSIVIKNKNRMGILNNAYFGIEYAFNVLNINDIVYFEDDVVLSKDVYDVTKFYIDLNDHNSIFCYLNKHSMINRNHSVYNSMSSEHILKIINAKYCHTPWGCAFSKVFWKNRWKPIIDINPNVGHDRIVDEYIKDINIYTPKISRMNTVGRIGNGYNELLYRSHGFDGVTICNDLPDKYNLIDVIKDS